MRTLAWFSFSFAFAVLLYVYLSPPIFFVLLGAGIFLCAAVLSVFLHNLHVRILLIALLGFGFGMLYCYGYQSFRLLPVKSLAGTEQTVRLTVLERPTKTAYGSKVIGRLAGSNTRVLLYLNEACPLALGDEVEVRARIRDSMTSAAGEALLYRQAKDISLVCNQMDAPVIRPATTLPLRLYPAALSGKLQDSILRIFPESSAGFIQALLTGNRDALSAEVKSDLSASGISHTIAVSGMHVSILLALLLFLLGSRKRLGAILGIPLILFYMAFVGFTPSVVRAAVMQSVFLLGFLLRRQNDPPTSLGFSLLLILLWNPWAIASVSLQLSYAAVIGLMLFVGRLNRFLAPEPVKKPCSLRKRLIYRFRSFLCISISATLSASVFTVPLVAVYFGTLCVLSLLTNLLAVWAVSFCFGLALLAAVLALIWTPAGLLLAYPAHVLARFILFSAQTVARIPLASVSVQNCSLHLWLIFAYFCLAVFLVLQQKRKLFWPLCTMLVCTLLLSIGISAYRQQTEESITAIDVGQGQSIYLHSDALSALIDCGGADAEQTADRIWYFLQAKGQFSLDLVIVTHYDADHAAGIPLLLHRLPVTRLLLPDVADKTGMRARIEARAKSCAVPVTYVRQDMAYSLPSGALQIFAPVSRRSDNAACLSVLYQTDTLSALITADMDVKAETALLHGHRLPPVDVLVAGHHGAASSTSQALLYAVQPKLVLVSVGQNSYGHPSHSALRRITQAGAAIYRTDQCGSITIGR